MDTLITITCPAEVQSQNSLARPGQQIPEASKLCDVSAAWQGRSGKNIEVVKECIASQVNSVTKQPPVPASNSNMDSTLAATEHVATPTSSDVHDGGLHVPSDDLSSIPMPEFIDPSDLDLSDLNGLNTESLDVNLSGYELDEGFFQASPNTIFGHIPTPSKDSQAPEATPVDTHKSHTVTPGTKEMSTLKRSINDLGGDSGLPSKQAKTMVQGNSALPFFYPFFWIRFPLHLYAHYLMCSPFFI